MECLFLGKRARRQLAEDGRHSVWEGDPASPRGLGMADMLLHGVADHVGGRSCRWGRSRPNLRTRITAAFDDFLPLRECRRALGSSPVVGNPPLGVLLSSEARHHSWVAVGD
jgi:hypothetical protein